MYPRTYLAKILSLRQSTKYHPSDPPPVFLPTRPDNRCYLFRKTKHYTEFLCTNAR